MSRRKTVVISEADLEAAVGLSASACHRRVRHREDSGIIRGCTALIGRAADGPGRVVLTQFTLDRQTEDYLNRSEAAVRRCPEVQDRYLMTGTADYRVKLKVSDAADHERLHKEVPSRAVPDRVATGNGSKSLSSRALLRRTGVHFGGERSSLPGAARLQSSFAIRTVVAAGRRL